MSELSSKFHFPLDIELNYPPLAEAWLEIRWQLEAIERPNVMRDPGYAFALGQFYEKVKDQFPYRNPLPASEAPDHLLPHMVRYQFRASKGGWPLLQIGPGVATVNFTESYNWAEFKEKALYLRSNIYRSYSESKLETERVILKYRNSEPFQFSAENFLDFLKDKLNTSIVLPTYIPGPTSYDDLPEGADIQLAFRLEEPQATGKLRVVTALRTQNGEEEITVWELSVESNSEGAPDIGSGEQFAHWLDSAHAVTHEWFFSLIDGPLLRKYQEGEN